MSLHIRKSPVDHKWRRWELKPDTSQKPEEARRFGVRMVQTCTGVFDTRAAAKRDTYGGRRRG